MHLKIKWTTTRFSKFIKVLQKFKNLPMFGPLGLKTNVTKINVNIKMYANIYNVTNARAHSTELLKIAHGL